MNARHHLPTAALLILASCAASPPPAAQCPAAPVAATGSGSGSAAPAAATQGSGAGLEYVGGTAIQAKDPKALSAWYTDRFGLAIKGDMPGGLYGGFEWNGTSFNIAIVAAGGKHPGAAPGTAYLVFHVTHYNDYLAVLAAKGLTPFTTTGDDTYGRFASFHDPEGNEVDIWGK